MGGAFDPDLTYALGGGGLFRLFQVINATTICTKPAAIFPTKSSLLVFIQCQPSHKKPNPNTPMKTA